MATDKLIGVSCVAHRSAAPRASMSSVIFIVRFLMACSNCDSQNSWVCICYCIFIYMSPRFNVFPVSLMYGKWCLHHAIYFVHKCTPAMFTETLCIYDLRFAKTMPAKGSCLLTVRSVFLYKWNAEWEYVHGLQTDLCN